MIALLQIAPLNGEVADARTRALALVEKAMVLSPEAAAKQCQEAWQLLHDAGGAVADLQACAALTGRFLLAAGEGYNGREWLKKAGAGALVRAELADAFLKEGLLAEAEKHLGQPAKKAQWWQTHAKILAAKGDPKAAQSAIEEALGLLAPEDRENKVVLWIDLAGFAARSGDWEGARRRLNQAAEELGKGGFGPEVIAAFAVLRADDPQLNWEDRFVGLEEISEDLEEMDGWSDAPGRVSFEVAQARAALACGEAERAAEVLTGVAEALPKGHSLRAQALALEGRAKNSAPLLREASAEAFAWLQQVEQEGESGLRGMQRTVDPISGLLLHQENEKALVEAVLEFSNLALRKRLGLAVVRPTGIGVQFFLYDEFSPQPRLSYGALVFEKRTVRVVKLGAADRIHRRLVQMVEAAEGALGGGEREEKRFFSKLTGVWKAVWEPLALPAGPEIKVSPAGAIYHVPWAILRDPDGRFLCETLPLVEVGSFWGNAVASVPAGDGGLAIGLVAAPKFGGIAADLGPLPMVRDEVGSLGMPVVLDPVVEVVLRSLQEEDAPGRLHFAGHGVVQPSGEGGLCFHDRLLGSAEISEWDLRRTKLVVLSACRSGLGSVEIGGAWGSLRRSFLVAGARQCIAANWKVRDDDAARLMRDFYRRSESGKKPADVLWHLQRDWIREKSGRAVAGAGAWSCEGP